LQSVYLEKGFLHGVQLSIPGEIFDGADLLSPGVANWCVARADRPPVDEDSTCATASLATAILAAGQVKVIAENAEQGAGGVGVEGATGPVDMEFLDRRHERALEDDRQGQGDNLPQCVWSSEEIV
jgi:hypothetical protein